MTQVSKTFSQHRRVRHDVLLAGASQLWSCHCFVALEIDDLEHSPSSSTRKGASRIVFTLSGIAARREKIDMQNEHAISHTKEHENGWWYHNFLEDSWTPWRNKQGKLNRKASIAPSANQVGINCHYLSLFSYLQIICNYLSLFIHQ